MYTNFNPFSLSQQENYSAQNFSYFSHLTFNMLPLYLAKQTLMQQKKLVCISMAEIFIYLLQQCFVM